MRTLPLRLTPAQNLSLALCAVLVPEHHFSRQPDPATADLELVIGPKRIHTEDTDGA